MKWLYLGDGYHGRCRCRRFGMLNEIPHRRLIRACSSCGRGKRGILELLKEVPPKVHVRTVELTAEDRWTLLVDAKGVG